MLKDRIDTEQVYPQALGWCLLSVPNLWSCLILQHWLGYCGLPDCGQRFCWALYFAGRRNGFVGGGFLCESHHGLLIRHWCLTFPPPASAARPDPVLGDVIAGWLLPELQCWGLCETTTFARLSVIHYVWSISFSSHSDSLSCICQIHKEPDEWEKGAHPAHTGLSYRPWTLGEEMPSTMNVVFKGNCSERLISSNYCCFVSVFKAVYFLSENWEVGEWEVWGRHGRVCLGKQSLSEECLGHPASNKSHRECQ